MLKSSKASFRPPFIARLENERDRSGSDAAEKVTILLVEDYMPNIMVATTLLENFGYRCEIAKNGSEGLAKYSVGKYSLVLLDIQMPEMDGYEVAKKIREIEHKTGSHIPIIAMTAYALPGDREKALKAGMDDYIAKPFDPAVLKHKIERLIKTPNKDRKI